MLFQDNTITINWLFRFGEYKYLKKIIEKGEIYINPVLKHKKDNKNNQRGDKNENLQFCDNNAKLYINDIPIDVGVKINSNINYYIYSLFFISNKDLMQNNIIKVPIDFIQKFGGSCILFRNDKIINQIVKKIIDKSLQPKWFPIEYVDLNNIQQRTNIFIKDIEYKEQRELRIAAPTTDSLPLKFNIPKFNHKDAILFKDVTSIIFKKNDDNNDFDCHITTKDKK